LKNFVIIILSVIVLTVGITPVFAQTSNLGLPTNFVNATVDTKTTASLNWQFTGFDPLTCQMNSISFNQGLGPESNLNINVDANGAGHLQIQGWHIFDVKIIATCDGSRSNFGPFDTTVNKIGAVQLILLKNVINDNGGTSNGANTQFTAQNTATGLKIIDEKGNSVASTEDVPLGTYQLTEIPEFGYAQVGNFVCNQTGGADNSTANEITFNGLNQIATCTATNNDIIPNLTFTKFVVGGGANPIDFQMNATNAGNGTIAFSQNNTGNKNIPATLYNLTEVGPTGFTAGPFVCTGTQQLSASQINLKVGETAVCTITNTLIPGPLDTTAIENLLEKISEIVNQIKHLIHQGG